jgi:hypothetical protein
MPDTNTTLSLIFNAYSSYKLRDDQLVSAAAMRTMVDRLLTGGHSHVGICARELLEKQIVLFTKLFKVSAYDLNAHLNTVLTLIICPAQM